MLYVFGGTKKARERMHTTREALEKRAPLAHIVRITSEDIEGVQIDDLLAAQGLFYAKRIVIFDNALGEKAAQEKIFPRLKNMADAEHVFLVLEEQLNTTMQKQLTKYATKAEIFEATSIEKEQADWTATNALESRDADRLWAALEKSFVKGVSVEQLHGQLFWKAKQMLMEKRFRRFNEAETKQLVASLAELPHQARRRGVEVEYALELFALKI